MPRLPSLLAEPAISRCAQRWPSVKRDKKQPAVMAPPQRPPMLVDVGKRGVQQVLVFVPQGQTPGAVVDVLTGGQQLVGKIVMVSHQAGGGAPEGDHAGAGEGGDVDQCFRFEAFGVGQGIAEDEAAFCVGVADFDGFAGHAGNDVRGAVGVAINGVFYRRYDHNQVER